MKGAVLPKPHIDFNILYTFYSLRHYAFFNVDFNTKL